MHGKLFPLWGSHNIQTINIETLEIRGSEISLECEIILI